MLRYSCAITFIPFEMKSQKVRNVNEIAKDLLRKIVKMILSVDKLLTLNMYIRHVKHEKLRLHILNETHIQMVGRLIFIPTVPSSLFEGRNAQTCTAVKIFNNWLILF